MSAACARVLMSTPRSCITWVTRFATALVLVALSMWRDYYPIWRSASADLHRACCFSPYGYYAVHVEKEQKSPENLAMAAEIRAERAAYRPKLSVKELARRSGIAYGTLNRILSGERDINTTQISRIAVVLGTTPAKLMDGATERLGGVDGLRALVSEVKSDNVTPLRAVEDFTLEELDREQYAANRDKEADTDEQFD